MANTITVSKTEQGKVQFQLAFKEMFRVTASVTDQDAVALTAIGEFDVSVPGVVAGDMVMVSFNQDLDDGTDQASCTAYCGAADTVTVQLHADNAEYAADDLNGATVKILVLRPGW